MKPFDIDLKIILFISIEAKVLEGLSTIHLSEDSFLLS